jgi:predicted PurR-regulated permease PerM
VVEVASALALGLFSAIFFLARGEEMWTRFLNQPPARVRRPWDAAARVGWGTLSGYTRGTILISRATRSSRSCS